MSKATVKKFKWSLDYNSKWVERVQSARARRQPKQDWKFLIWLNFVCVLSSFICRKNTELASPPGYNPQVGQTHSEVAKDGDQSQLIIKKSWDVALGPIKGVSGHQLEVAGSWN